MLGSSSYPFLAIARWSGDDYGDVLSYADWVRNLGYPTHWQALAVMRLSPRARDAVDRHLGKRPAAPA